MREGLGPPWSRTRMQVEKSPSYGRGVLLADALAAHQCSVDGAPLSPTTEEVEGAVLPQ